MTGPARSNFEALERPFWAFAKHCQEGQRLTRRQVWAGAGGQQGGASKIRVFSRVPVAAAPAPAGMEALPTPASRSSPPWPLGWQGHPWEDNLAPGSPGWAFWGSVGCLAFASRSRPAGQIPERSGTGRAAQPVKGGCALSPFLCNAPGTRQRWKLGGCV